MALMDRYDLVRHLGSGGGGDVHLARDRLAFGREVALKTLRARVDDVLRSALEREFSTLAALRVPGVAQVYDFGIVREAGERSGRPYFTRAYVDGRPLDQAALGLDLHARVELIVRAAAVIAPLHRVGVVHGDVKPGNIIVDADAAAWLIDFGLARANGPAAVSDMHGAIGTPLFMAPELQRGAAPSISGDVFALGVSLWLVATDQDPYAQYGARAFAAKLAGQPALLPRNCDSATRAVLEVALRALAPDPRDRFPSVDEFQASLDRLLPRATRVQRPFVLPRPRGHEESLVQLDSFLHEARARIASGVLHAPAGGGKSLILSELKWRCQLAAQLVLEVFAARSGGAGALIGLFEQLGLVLGPAHEAVTRAADALEDLRAGRFLEGAVTEALGRLLRAVAVETPLLLLVDDLDQADATLGAVLRSAIHADEQQGIALIATARNPQAAAVRELQPELVLALPRLSPEISAALCSEALGPLDQAVVSALIEHAQGLPGGLASAFYELSSLPAVTPSDVQRLPPPEAAEALIRARLARTSPAERHVLDAVALVSALPEADLAALLSQAAGVMGSEPVASLIARLEAAGLVARDASRLVLADASLRKGLLRELGAQGRQQLAAALLAIDWPLPLGLVERAELAVAAQAEALTRELAPSATELLARQGAHARAAELLEALLQVCAGEQRARNVLKLAAARHALGEDERAAELALGLAAASPDDPGQGADALLMAARSLTALGRWDDAVAALDSVPEGADPARRAQVQRELAKIHLRRGDHAAAERAVQLGLACAGPHDPVRVELLCSRGIVAGYRGDQAAARACYEEALVRARADGVRADEANVLAYLAIGAQRAGDMLSARDLISQSLEIARELGDVGSMARFSLNLGAVLYYLGDPAAAAEHYDSAARLARRAGRTSTRAYARTNLAHVHLYFGLYERARGEIEELLASAQTEGQKAIVAQVTVLRADLLSRTGDVERALIQYDDAIARFVALGQTREVAEHNLDAAEMLLNRGGAADASAAAAYVARARERLAQEQADDLRLRLDLVVARVRLANGDAESAARGIEDVLTRAQTNRDREVEWSALTELAHAQERLGLLIASKRSVQAALEVLEHIALRVPREYREAFWQDPRRRAVRELSQRSEHAAAGREFDPVPAGSEERDRLFQIIRRLASERDLDRLLERIIESAVDLSGAERGSVLLVDAAGHLMPQITRARPALQDEAHELFSRSIAEAVLIDGEPIVTVDAVADGRLQSYVSVHRLMLRSVACLPIRGYTGTVGVLYLEHRRSRGRFSESTVELLGSFADQAAIALENARQLAEIQRQKDELEQANQELREAKGQLEDLLATRTLQLDDVQRELARATQKRELWPSPHGIIGRNPALQRVLDGVKRLAGNNVPVVICGETGTGKELVARAIHYSGARANQPFIAINCGALPESLLESELFGYTKGAFSGADRDRRGLIAAASGGTLFLDEVSEMPARMQAGLLRVLQERKVVPLGSETEESVDVRIVTATHRPLATLVARGEFREDLMYRLSVVELNLPPLRARREDIPLLCDHFLREFAAREGIPRCLLSRPALATLMDQAWPGNIRQLSHVLLQACVMAEGSSIGVSDLGLSDSIVPPPTAAGSDTVARPGLLVENLDHHRQAEKQRILHALEAAGWNRVKAAQALGMPRRTFYRRLSDYSIL